MGKKYIRLVVVFLIIVFAASMVLACDKEDGKSIEQIRETAILDLISLRSEYPDHLYSIENINKLGVIFDNAKKDIESASQASEIEVVLDGAEAKFLAVLTLAQENEIRQNNLIKEFALYKRERQNELELYRALLDNDLYSESNIAVIDEIISTASEQLFFADSHKEVLELYNSAVERIFAVPTIAAEQAAEINKAKENAVLTLEEHRNSKDDENYSESAIGELNLIVESISKKIISAVTIAEIDAFLQQGITQLDNIGTLGLSALDKKKKAATDELDRYRFTLNDSDYTAHGIAELDRIMGEATQAIQNANTAEQVESILQSAKTSLSEIETYKQLLDKHIHDTLELLAQHRATKTDSSYSDEAIEALDAIMRNAITAINNAKTFEGVDFVFAEATNALDNVDVIESALAKIKSDRILELDEYHASFNSADYTESGVGQLESILSQAKQSIVDAGSLAEVNQACNTAYSQLNAVLTFAQELAQAKIAAAAELGEYRLIFDDGDYSAFGIAELNRFLSEGATAINQSDSFAKLDIALFLAKGNLEGVLDYAEELSFRKARAIGEIAALREEKNDADFSENAIARLDSAVSNYTSQINLVLIIEDIEGLKELAIAELNSVLTYAQELARDIDLRIGELRQYHTSKLSERYTDDGAVLLENALQNGITAINNSTTLESLNTEFELAKSNIDKVKTYAEELDEAKANAENNIRQYRSSKLNNEYTSTGIDRLNFVLNTAIENIWLAENFTQITQIQGKCKLDLDSVLTHAQELVILKALLTQDLTDYRMLKQDINYTSEGVARLDSTLQAGIEEISGAQTITQASEAFERAKIGMDAVPNANQGIQAVQSMARDTLNEYRNSKKNSEYTAESIGVMDSALNHGLQNINNAETETEVLNALEVAIAAIGAVRTIAEDLSIRKSDALTELRAYRLTKNNIDYSENGIELLESALLSGEIAVDNADSIEEVNLALREAKTALDEVQTYEEETNFDIWEIIDAAATELDEYRRNLGADDYGERGNTQLDTILVEAMGELFGAETPDSVAQILFDAKGLMEAVLKFKDEYCEDLNSYRLSFEEDDYSAVANSELDEKLQDFTTLITESAHKGIALEHKLAAIKAMDSVLPILGQSRDAIKDLAILDIENYRNSKLIADYDANANASLDRILLSATNQIMLATNEAQIESIAENAKKSLDTVLTVAQNDAIIWLTDYREIFEDVDYSDEDAELLDSILDEFVDGILDFACLQTELANAAKAMDSVPPLAGDTRQMYKNTYIHTISEFRSFFDAREYSEISNSEFDKILQRALNDIQLVIVLEDNTFIQIVEQAKAEMNLIQTLKDEAVLDLQAYRMSFNESEYSSEALEELDTIVSDFITTSFPPEQLSDALIAAKAQMDLVEKIPEEFEE